MPFHSYNAAPHFAPCRLLLAPPHTHMRVRADTHRLGATGLSCLTSVLSG